MYTRHLGDKKTGFPRGHRASWCEGHASESQGRFRVAGWVAQTRLSAAPSFPTYTQGVQTLWDFGREL